MPPFLLRLLILLAVIQVGLPLVLSLARNKMIFIPFDHPTAEEGLRGVSGVDARVVRIVREDGRELAAYDMRPRSRARDADDEADAALPVVLFFHGNAGNIGMRAGFVAWFAEHTGTRVVMPDYSGYGGNAGSPSESELYRDADAAYDWLLADGVDPRRLVLYGNSVGGAPAVHLASSREAAGLVMQSSFSSLSSAARRVYPWLPLGAVFAAGAYPNADRLARVKLPVLLVHGTADRIMPYAESEKLRDVAPAGTELLLVEGAGHNDLFDVGGRAHLQSLGARFVKWTRDE